MFLFFAYVCFLYFLCCCRCAAVLAGQNVAYAMISFERQQQDASLRACYGAP